MACFLQALFPSRRVLDLYSARLNRFVSIVKGLSSITVSVLQHSSDLSETHFTSSAVPKSPAAGGSLQKDPGGPRRPSTITCWYDLRLLERQLLREVEDVQNASEQEQLQDLDCHRLRWAATRRPPPTSTERRGHDSRGCPPRHGVEIDPPPHLTSRPALLYVTPSKSAL